MVSSVVSFSKGSTLASIVHVHIHQRSSVEQSLVGEVPCCMKAVQTVLWESLHESSRHGSEKKMVTSLWVGVCSH
jgi:hypothetical protein